MFVVRCGVVNRKIQLFSGNIYLRRLKHTPPVKKMQTCSETKSPLISREVITPVGMYTLKACSKGIHHLSINGVTDENFNPNVSAAGIEQPTKSVDEATAMEKAVNWLLTYFGNPSDLPGKIPPVCFPTDSSTEFERKVWTALGEKVAFGKTITYSGLGEAAIDNPKASRAVSTAMRKNPVPLIIPCHRVIRSDGQIGNYSGGGTKVKKWLLQHENAME